MRESRAIFSGRNTIFFILSFFSFLRQSLDVQNALCRWARRTSAHARRHLQSWIPYWPVVRPRFYTPAASSTKGEKIDRALYAAGDGPHLERRKQVSHVAEGGSGGDAHTGRSRHCARGGGGGDPQQGRFRAAAHS